MEKFSRSTDQKQQNLRDEKRQWNMAANEFVKRLGAFRKYINGRGSSQYGLPPIKIQNAFGTEFSFLNELTSNFQQLAEQALKIQQEQEEYSRTRTKSHKELEEVGKIATAAPLAKTQGYLILADRLIETLVAKSDIEQEMGLMYEKNPVILTFAYTEPKINKFWMKNTPSELDIIFSLNGKITQICKGEPYSTSLIGGFYPSDMVVEMPYGTCQNLNIKIGDNISLIC